MSEKAPLRIRLRSGEELGARELGLGGFVAAPAGVLVLGGTSSPSHVGKFCIGVRYADGQTGVIAQEEIASIRDSEDNPVAYGNPKYPGHPDFDPRNGFDPMAAQIESMRQISILKRQRLGTDRSPEDISGDWRWESWIEEASTVKKAKKKAEKKAKKKARKKAKAKKKAKKKGKAKKKS